MSFRRFPFQFSDVDSFDRMNTRSEESRNMFQETSSSSRRSDWQQNESHLEEPTWRTHPSSFRHSSDSVPSSAQNVRATSFPSNWSGSSIPIKVIHEKMSNKKTGSDTSSEYNGSTQESSQTSTTQSPREPRVHHIPIMVEPRDGSSSGYVSDSGSEKSTDAAKQNQANDQNSQEKRVKRNYSENKINGLSQHSENTAKTTNEATKATKASESFRKPHVHHIPITVEPRAGDILPPGKSNITKKHSPLHASPSRSSSDDQPFEGPVFSSRKADSASNVDQQKFSGKKNLSKPGNGPHVTKIPINVSTDQPSQSSSTSFNQADIALDQIAKIDNEVAELRKQVDAFSGTNQDKRYRYLDEMLMRCMLKLDNIDTIGIDAIRKSRKLVINKVQECISLLESKLFSLKQKAETVENGTSKTDGIDDSNAVQTDNITVSIEEEENSPSVKKKASVSFEDTVSKITGTNENNAISLQRDNALDQIAKIDDEAARTNEVEEKMEIDNQMETKSTNTNKNNCQPSLSEAMEVDKEANEHKVD